MTDISQKIKQITLQMAKKGTFIQAAQELSGLIRSSYKGSEDAVQAELFAASKRAAHLLRSRYTAAGFWRAGKEVFEAQVEAAEGETDRSAAAKEWLALAKAEVEADGETSSPAAPSGTPSRQPPAPSTFSDDGPTPRTQNAPTEGLGVLGEEVLENVIRDVDLEQLLAMLANGAQVLNEGGGGGGGGGESGPPPASREARFNLAVKTVDGDVLCAVCQEVFPPKGKAKVMPCGHPFHYDCLMEWLERHNSCPTCRFALPSEKPAFDLAADRVAARDPTSTPLYS